MSIARRSHPIDAAREHELRTLLDNPEFSAAVAAYDREDDTHDIPYGGGSSTDWRTIFWDHRIVAAINSGKFRLAGKAEDPRPTGKVHEAIEGAVIHLWPMVSKLLGWPQTGPKYLRAHDLADIAERHAVAHKGWDWAEYQREWLKLIEPVEKAPVTNPPSNLLLDAYQGTPLWQKLSATQAQSTTSPQKSGKLWPPTNSSASKQGSASPITMPNISGNGEDALPGGANGLPKPTSTTVYIVRHGATKLNNQVDMSEDRIRGWSDVPLVEEGRQEARGAAKKLVGKGIKAIVTSDLSRAHETADIIGKIIGIKPVASQKLRPWNLGKLTGCTTKEALPKIAEYVRNRPDEAVPDGESFNSFKARAFAGLAEAVAQNAAPILIVTHHRDERLFEAWQKLGQPASHAIDLDTFLQKGDPPGGIKMMQIGKSESATAGAADMETDGAAPTKLSHAAVHYGLAKPNGDKCATCKSYLGPNNCIKVVNPIYPAGWCNVGHSKTDGHPFDAKAEAQEQEQEPGSEVMPSAAGADMGPASNSSDTQPQPAQSPAGASPVLAHGRAIAGAKALHAVGHIDEKERDKHVKASTAALAKAGAKPRKPFGSWAQ
jgi:broad specificity phosphatase PhoE